MFVQLTGVHVDGTVLDWLDIDVVLVATDLLVVVEVIFEHAEAEVVVVVVVVEVLVHDFVV